MERQALAPLEAFQAGLEAAYFAAEPAHSLLATETRLMTAQPAGRARTAVLAVPTSATASPAAEEQSCTET